MSGLPPAGGAGQDTVADASPAVADTFVGAPGAVGAAVGVTVFDAVTHAKLGEISVGIAPRSIAVAPGGRIWVTNRQSATISVIDPGTLIVTSTIVLPRASQPYGIAFVPGGTTASSRRRSRAPRSA